MENKKGEVEAINNGVEMKRRLPADFMALWKDVFGGNKKILKEKLVYVDEEMKSADHKIMSEVVVKPAEDGVYLGWRKEDGDVGLLVINDTYRSGVQTNDEGEKSIILIKTGVDQRSGGKKEIVRRYSALK